LSVLEKKFKPGDLITSDDYNAIIEELKKLIEIAKPIYVEVVKPGMFAQVSTVFPVGIIVSLESLISTVFPVGIVASPETIISTEIYPTP